MSTIPSAVTQARYAPGTPRSVHSGGAQSSGAASHVAQDRRQSGATTPRSFTNNPYGQASLVVESSPQPSSTARHGYPSQVATAGTGFAVPDTSLEDTSEITSLFTTFDPTTAQSRTGRGVLDGSASRLHARGSLSRSQPLGNSTTHSPYAPVTEEGLRAARLQQQQQQHQSLHQSQEFPYGAAFEYGPGVSAYSRFNGSTSQADLNPLSFNFDQAEGPLRTPLSAGNSTTDVATLVDVYETDTITVSVKQRTNPSQRVGSRGSSLNGSSMAIQQMAEAAEKANMVHSSMKSPASSFHASSHQHYVPSANTIHQGGSLPQRAGIYPEGVAVPPSPHAGAVNAGQTYSPRPLLQKQPQLLPSQSAYSGNTFVPCEPPTVASSVGTAYGHAGATPFHVDPRHVGPVGYGGGVNVHPPLPPHQQGYPPPMTRANPATPPQPQAPRKQPQKQATVNRGGAPISPSQRTGKEAGRTKAVSTGVHGGQTRVPAALSHADLAPASAGPTGGEEVAAPSGNSRRASHVKTGVAEHADRSLPVRGFVVVKGKYDGHRFATTEAREDLPAFGSAVIVEGDRGEDIGVLTGYIPIAQMIEDCLQLHKLRQAEDRRRALKAAEKEKEGTASHSAAKEDGCSDEDGDTDKGKSGSRDPTAPCVDVDGVVVAEDEAGQQAQIQSIVFTFKSWPYYLRPATAVEEALLPTLRVEEKQAFNTAHPVVTHFVTIAFQQQQHRQQKALTAADGTAEADTTAAPVTAEGESVHRPAPADPNEVKLVDCEYQLDHKKLTLYVVRPSREVFVDFRRMQRKLFRAFHCRIWFVYMDEVSEDSDSPASLAHQLQRPNADR